MESQVKDTAAWRAQMLRTVCRQFAIFGSLPALIGAYFTWGFVRLPSVGIVLTVAVSWLGALLPPLPRRATLLFLGLLTCAMGTALSFVAAAGMAPGTSASMIVIIALVGAAYGVRVAIALSVGAMLALLLIGAGFAHHLIEPISPSTIYDWTQMGIWYRVVAMLFALSILLPTAIASLIRRMERGIAERDDALARLRKEARERLDAEHRRSEAELALTRAQQLETVGRLAGGIAHDFNNLLSVILTYAQLGQRNLAPDSPLRNDLEEIGRAGARAAGLVDQLLTYSRRRHVEPRLVDLNQVVTTAEPSIRAMLGLEHELELALTPAIWPAKADALQLERALLSLASNSRDAMPGRGRFSIRTENRPLAGDEVTEPSIPGGDYVLLTVADTGSGMDSETRAHIFEPFFTTKEQGSGLGLSTVFGTVQQSGGYLTVESAPNAGTTIRIYLPRETGSNDEPTR